MKLKLLSVFVSAILLSYAAAASKIFIPMDEKGQANHLKAYGIAFAAMQAGTKVDWLLNYKGGSFAIESSKEIESMCKLRGVSYTKMNNKEYAQVVKKVTDPSFDGQLVKLEKAPKIAVYTPLNKNPWDDAVTLALTYAEIPFDKLYADEVLAGKLDKYDWLHLHHEDFTGQYGKFWAQYRNVPWYMKDQQTMEAIATRNGYKKVSQMQLGVVKKIRDFVGSGGNMFAMCSATETFDIALAADGTDISENCFDGDPMDAEAQKKLDFNNCFAFKDFTISTNSYEYSRSNIDYTHSRAVTEINDHFKLINPPGKMDVVPVMLCQNHTNTINGFMGQTTAFRKEVIKPGVMILGDRVEAGEKQVTDAGGNRKEYYLRDYEARYIHGEFGKGSWTFLGGHDPEDYQHFIGDAPTDLKNHPNSPGYRLILNNVLFPAVEKTVVPVVNINVKEDNKVTATGVSNTPLPGKISIAPNPTSNELVISHPSASITQVTIMDISGKVVISNTYHAASVNVDMKDLAPGMYLVKVNGEYIGKVIRN